MGSPANSLSSIAKDEYFRRLKIVFLAVTFFLVIGAYTLAKELGATVFVTIVGKEYVPRAKLLTMLLFIPAILLYSKLSDKLRRYKLLSLYSLFFAIVGLLFAYLLGPPSIGIANTDSDPRRIFGWLFYFFVEGYNPFIISVFWAFANSISSPEEAKKGYSWVATGSKIGGMLSAGIAWALFSWNARADLGSYADVIVHQVVYAVSSCMLLLVPCMTFYLMKRIPGRYLHGYEAVYQAEKKKKDAPQTGGVISGLILLLRYPYVLGIFGMVYFYEVVATVLSYLRLGIAQSNSVSVSGVSSFLFQLMFMTHAIGFLISIFGTRTLLQKLGERICLMLIPLFSGLLLLVFMVYPTQIALMCAFVALKSINYAFSWPVRESLYIPTIKEIKFKSKSWVDAFGAKFAKTSGSAFNALATYVTQNMFLTIYSFFFASVVSLWFVTAYALGRRFDRAVANNEVIGIDSKNVLNEKDSE